MQDAHLKDGVNLDLEEKTKKYLADFETALDDNLNTSVALAALHNLVREVNTALAHETVCTEDRSFILHTLDKFDSVLGIFGEEKKEMLDAEIENLIEERQEARRQRNFSRSDEIRDLLAEKGIILGRHERRRKMEEKITEKQFCPICLSEVQKYERYPNYVCANCSEKAVSEDGRPLEFYNETLTGGFLAFYADTKEKYDSHTCYINNEKCFANEAYLGGIVIQTSRPGLINKLKGGLIGLLVGDALGVPFEFHAREEIPPFEEIEFEPPANFRRAHAGVPVGTWSDDGAQALCLLASLLECGKFDAKILLKRLIRMVSRRLYGGWQKFLMSAFRRSERF